MSNQLDNITTGIYVPALRYISSISISSSAVVTFTQAHTYTEGEVLSFRVSPPYGMIQMNNRQGRVIGTSTMTVTMNIDSLQFFPFTDPGGTPQYPAVCIPVGSGIVPGSFPIATNIEAAFDQLPS